MSSTQFKYIFIENNIENEVSINTVGTKLAKAMEKKIKMEISLNSDLCHIGSKSFPQSNIFPRLSTRESSDGKSRKSQIKFD
jgi:hypothetical protein